MSSTFFRKILTLRVNDQTPEDHQGRLGEITYRDGYLYYHDGVTPGGELINGGGSGGGGPTSWASVTGKPSFAAVATSGSYADLTNKPSIPGVGDFIFSAGDASLPAGSTMTLSTFRSGANEESKLTLSPTTESSLYAAGVLKLGTGYGSGSEKYWQFGANGNLTIPGDIVDSTGTSVLGGNGFSGDYNDLTNKPSLFSGAYADLTGQPSIPDLTGYATETWVTSQGFGSGGSASTGNITFSGDNISGSDNVVRIRSLNTTTTASYSFTPGVDYSTAVWDGQGITFNDPTQAIYDAIWALTNLSTIQVQVAGSWFTVTSSGSSTPGMPQAPTLFINQYATGGPLNIDIVDINIIQGTESYAEIDGSDFRVDVQDDIRIYGNDTFLLYNKSTTDPIRIETNDGSHQWEFNSDGDLILPDGGGIKNDNGNSLLFSGSYNDLSDTPTLFSGDYDDLNNKPTIRIAVPTGSGPGGNLQADSLALAGLNPVTDIPSTWGGDLILQGGVGGANGDLYGEVRIKSGQIGANYEWHFTTDKKIKLPAGGDIVDSTGASVLGGGSSFSGSYDDLTDKPTIPADVSDLTDTTNLLGGGGTTLPADASGYLNNNGSGTLTWVAGNPAGSGMLPYTDVVVFSNTVAGDWTSFTLSGTMDSFSDYNNNIATITLSSQTALGVQAVSNTKTLWINDSRVDSNDYMVIEFPPSPTVGDVFNIVTTSALTTVNAGSFVVGQTYTILTTGDTNWTAIGSSYGGQGQSFVATGIGSGTGTATTPAGAKKIIYKPAAGQRARTYTQGQTASLWFGTGGTYDFMYADAAVGNSGMLLTFVFAGAIDGTPSWYQVYF